MTELEELRPRAFAIAYRMLGSVSEAEDVVQEALLRLYRAEREGERIESPRAYLSTVVTRLAIDQLRSARVRRETYVGEWLPEPLVDDPESDPARHAEMADSLSLAFLVLLESLSPEQRAVFLLREVFDYPYDRIAEIVDKSEPNVRQLASRARQHVEGGRVRFDASREQREELADRFFAAAAGGRHGGAGGAARRGRRAARRRRRQGARAGARAVRPLARGTDAAQLGARRAAGWRGRAAPRRRQRPARRDAARPATAACSASWRSTSPTGRSRGSARWSTRRSSRHLGEVANAAELLGRGAARQANLRGGPGARAPGCHSSSMLWAIAASAPVTVRCSASLSPSKISRWRALTQVRFSSSTARPPGGERHGHQAAVLRVVALAIDEPAQLERPQRPRRRRHGHAGRPRHLAHGQRLVGHRAHHEVLGQRQLGLPAGHAPAARLEHGPDQLLERLAESLVGLGFMMYFHNSHGGEV